MPSQNAVRDSITNRIIEALKAGTIPWRKPWTTIADPVRLPTNFVTKKAYQGINVLLLWLTQQQRGYPISYWASYKAWEQVGAQVRRGEKATNIVLWKPIERIVEEDGEKKKQSFPILKTWPVFNITQVQGEVTEQFRPKPTDGVKINDVDRTDFDEAIQATGADIRYGFNKAAYRLPPADFIVMPNEESFESFPAFAETLAHEVAHWSEVRTNWTGSYAEGELRAEITASFVTSALGIPNCDETNHAAYVGSWLKALEDDPKHIFKAAKSASVAADFILSFSQREEVVSEELVEMV